jgi:cytosine/adenosine deaminase-related metal-dependent hydrolase
VAEDGADVDDAVRRGYRGPLERLHALGGLPAGSILAHGVHLDAEQVRTADALGCWIVQNPRSNRHNKVGYPRALGESARVALGTDGFVSDMREETSVLREEALAHDEDAGVVARRAAGGRTLVAEICGFSADGPAAPEVSDELMSEIRAEAREAAAVLWTRMAAL